MMFRSSHRFTIAIGLPPLVLGMLAHDVGAEGKGAHSDLSLLRVHNLAGIACSACHSQTTPEPRPGFANCVACHGTMIGTDSPFPAEGPDPHRSPHLEVDEPPDCTSCHQIHQSSEVTCTMCHRTFRFNLR